MNLQEVLTKIANPDKILSVVELEQIIDDTTTLIYELENDLSKQDFKVSERLRELCTTNSVAMANVILHTEEVYQEWKRLDIIFKTLKGYRNNVRRKRDRVVKY